MLYFRHLPKILNDTRNPLFFIKEVGLLTPKVSEHNILGLFCMLNRVSGWITGHVLNWVAGSIIYRMLNKVSELISDGTLTKVSNFCVTPLPLEMLPPALARKVHIEVGGTE